MTKALSTAQVKAHLLESIELALRERSVIITHDGKPVAVLVSYEDLLQLQRLRTARQTGGLANLAEGWEDADQFAEELDEVVQQRYQNISQK